MKKNVISIVLILCTTIQASSIIDGSLDPSFGTGGIVTTDFAGANDVANAVLFQPDGKIIAVGFASIVGFDFGLIRYNSDGSLDSSFGTAGIVTTAITSSDQAHTALLQPDGKIIAIGFTNVGADPNFALVRYNSDGSPDTSFGTDGIVTTPVTGVSDMANAALLQPDGKIIAVGQANINFALVRYNPDGSLDSSFGTDGIVTTAVGTSGQALAALLQSDGKIIAAGRATVGGSSDFALVRYNSDGSLDSSFGTAGIVTTAISVGAFDQASAALLQPDGKIIAVGRAGSASNFALARYHSDGSLDSSFGTNGIVTTDLGGSDVANAAILQPDGKIIAVGVANGDFALARYHSDGSLDSSFGTAGKVTTNLSGSDTASAVLLQSDGKIIAAGRAFIGGNFNFALARYLVPSLEISQLAKDFRSKYYLLLNPN